MKIGIYKPYKKIFFHDDINDLSAVSYEVVNVCKIFAERGHEIVMLSKSDLKENPKLKNISQGDIKNQQKFDRIFLFSGTFEKDKYGEEIIPLLKDMTNRLDFILTDLRLLPQVSNYRYFSKVYTQATKPLAFIPSSIPQQYGGVSEFYCYNLQPRKDLLKTLNFVFCGTERGRLNDILEYIRRPEVIWIGKSKTFDFDNRVDRKEFKRILDRTRFSITIADENYNKNHFITPRPHEHAHHNIINFIDSKFDPDEHFETKDSWFRVNNYLELYQKLQKLIKDPEVIKLRLKEQQEFLKIPTFKNGDYVYKRLDGDLK